MMALYVNYKLIFILSQYLSKYLPIIILTRYLLCG